MIENLKIEIEHTIYIGITRIVNWGFDIYVICRYPWKHISIWLSIILSCFIYKNIEVQLKWKEMFLMSVGLVSIMTFISNYLENQTVDIENKENYYLGYNIKKLKFHDDFWLKSFSTIPARLYFWIIAGIPGVVLCSETYFQSRIFNNFFAIFATKIQYIKSAWLAVFIVSSFFCAALLIESVALSSNAFTRSYLYKTTNQYEEYKIKLELTNYSQKLFKTIFSFKNIINLDCDFYANVETLISYIVNRGNEVSKTDNEKIEFYMAAFSSEQKIIDNILTRVFHYKDSEPKNNIKDIITYFFFKQRLKLLKNYYNQKWNILARLDVVPLGLIQIVEQDLQHLLRIEEEMKNNKEYKDVFWGNYRKNIIYNWEDEPLKSNVCISEIIEIVEKKLSDISFLESIHTPDNMMCVFKILNQIDTEVQGAHYFSDVFDIVFEHVINEKYQNDMFIKDFSEKMQNKYLPAYVLNALRTTSKYELMQGGDFSNEILEYLLSFLEFEDIVVVLIFRLAYAERSHRKIMNIEEFKIWEMVINKNRFRKNIMDLQKSNFINELCSELSNSYVSHFLFKEFIEWLWDSLFKTFDDNQYIEFKKLGQDSIRRNFELKSYIIFRLLLVPYHYDVFSSCQLSQNNQNEIFSELSEIKDIMENSGIYVM